LSIEFDTMHLTYIRTTFKYSLKFRASAMSGAGVNSQPVKKSAIHVENKRDKGERITRRRKEPKTEKMRRTRIEQNTWTWKKCV